MKLTTDDTDCTDGVRRGLEKWNQRLFLPSVIFVIFVVKNFFSSPAREKIFIQGKYQQL